MNFLNKKLVSRYTSSIIPKKVKGYLISEEESGYSIRKNSSLDDWMFASIISQKLTVINKNEIELTTTNNKDIIYLLGIGSAILGLVISAIIINTLGSIWIASSISIFSLLPFYGLWQTSTLMTKYEHKSLLVKLSKRKEKR